MEVDSDACNLADYVALGDSVGTDVVVQIVDNSGTRSALCEYSNAVVSCTAVPCSETDAPIVVSSGEPASSIGNCLRAAMKDGSFFFPSIILDRENIETISADEHIDTVTLRFEFQGNVELRPFEKVIRYYSNANQASIMQKLSQELDVLRNQKCDFETRKADLINRLSCKEREVEALMMRVRELNGGTNPLTQTQDDACALLQETFQDYVQRQKETVDKMEMAASQSRQAVKGVTYRNDFELTKSVSLIETSPGIVVDMGFVMDEDDARILSWAAEKAISAGIVYNPDDAMTLLENGCSRAIVVSRRYERLF